MTTDTAVRSKWLLLALIAGFIFVSDQLSKYWAVDALTHAFEVAGARTTSERVKAFVAEKNLLERGLSGPPIHVTRVFWDFRYTQNRGAAWGFLNNTAASFRVPFFHLVTLGAIVFIALYYRKLERSQLWLRIALALLLGGALGNGLDRVLRNYVIDFIDWHWADPDWQKPHLHWPTFNIADVGVSIGLVMLLLESLFVKQKSEAGAKAEAAKG